ncbi:MAG: DUF1565 domain-containing protein, partial [Rhodopirellula sp. JB044]|uniref:DUF1565 domain-containing protein n=1 Tax=Rhodopirellula sp. JB044 TaxID=3342844 RepID=UPI00370B9514
MRYHLIAPAAVLLAVGLLSSNLDSLHAETYVVSVSGDDQSPGNSEHPFRTISRAAEAAMPGDTILVRAGVYRERVSPPRGGLPGKPITYRGESLGKVFLKGSELWSPQWREHSTGVFYATPDAALFDD